MATSPYVIEVTDEQFQAEVLQRSLDVPVVVDFWAPWCGPCRALGPIMEKLAEEHQGRWILAKVNTEENPRVAQALQIRGIPAVKAVVGGRIVSEFSGVLPEDKIREWINGFAPDQLEQLLAAGKQALLEEDEETALQAYMAVLGIDSSHIEAKLAVARIAVARGEKETARQLLDGLDENDRITHASEIAAIELLLEIDAGAEADLIARIKEDPRDYQARHDLAMSYAARAAYDEALEELLAIVIRDRSWEEDKARESMVKLFGVMGLNSEATRKWQKKLGRAMY